MIASFLVKEIDGLFYPTFERITSDNKLKFHYLIQKGECIGFNVRRTKDAICFNDENYALEIAFKITNESNNPK